MSARIPQGFPLYVLCENRRDEGIVFVAAVVAWDDLDPVVAPLEFDVHAGVMTAARWQLSYATDPADLHRLAQAGVRDAERDRVAMLDLMANQGDAP